MKKSSRSLVSPIVRAQARERFAGPEADEVISALGTTKLPLLDAPDRHRERARVHMAVIKVADGDLQRFRRALTMACTDWRDVLLAAGLAHADWPEVLRTAGWRVP